MALIFSLYFFKTEKYKKYKNRTIRFRTPIGQPLLPVFSSHATEPSTILLYPAGRARQKEGARSMCCRPQVLIPDISYS